MNDTNTENKKKKVSYSQYSTYYRCPHQWELDYLKNLRVKDGNVNTAFGTAVHHALQTFLTEIFNPPDNKPKKIDMYSIFVEKFKEEREKITLNENKISDADFNAFCGDGKKILKELSQDNIRKQYFSENVYELIGIEIPLDIPLINNIDFVGYIDIVLKYKNEDRYKIIDIKTSSFGWNKWVKNDESKFVQLHLYKHVYSKKFNVPHDNIDVEFFIVKRKPFEYERTRIQLFVPPHGNLDINKSLKHFISFLNEAFNPDGTYNDKKEYQKNPGPKNKNCKYCPHLGKLCDGSN